MVAQNKIKAFRLPNADERVAVFGHTGSGKTQFGAWLLSVKNLKTRPHYILDFKGDALLNSLRNVREIGFETVKKPGLYILHSRPDLEDQTEEWLGKLWEQENLHLYVDEGYMVPNQRNGWFSALQTQGRSKNISITTLSQRPVDVTRFVFSEASHVAMFHLNDDRDIKTAEQIIPRGFATWLPPEFKQSGELPEYHSRWYRVNDRSKFVLRPVPDAATIRNDIDSQLTPKMRWL